MRRFVLVAAGLSLLAACATVRRARSYPTEAEITSVAWYEPAEPVPGRAGAALRAGSEPLDPAVAARVTAWAAEQNTTSLVVLRRGELVYEWHAAGFDRTDRTNSMSMAKTVVALLVGIAIGDGAIGSVDDPVAKYVPELGGDKRQHITIRHLLEMSSGLRNDDALRLGSDLVKLYLGPRLERALLDIPAEKLPGQTFDYNNANTQLLALVIERATGRSWTEYLSERLWRPIGAADASVWLDRRGGTGKAFCCLMATSHDWARVGQLLLDEGAVGPTQVVPQDWVRRMALPSPHNPDYGWQLWRAEVGPGSTRADDRSEPFADPGTLWLDGRGGQRVYVLPAQGLVIVRVGEAPASWDDAFLPNTLHRAWAAPAPAPAPG